MDYVEFVNTERCPKVPDAAAETVIEGLWRLQNRELQADAVAATLSGLIGVGWFHADYRKTKESYCALRLTLRFSETGFISIVYNDSFGLAVMVDLALKVLGHSQEQEGEQKAQ